MTPTVNTTCPACNGRVIPNYGVIRLRDNTGHSNYNGLQTAYTIRNLYNQLTLTSAFTWSKTMDNISEVYSFLGSGSVVLAQDPFNTSAGDGGLSNHNVPKALSVEATWNLSVAQRNLPLVRSRCWRMDHRSLRGGQAGRPMTMVQQNLNVNPLEDSAAASFVGGSASMPPFLANPSAQLGSVGEFLSNGTLVNLANTSQAVSISSVHWVYNTLAADKYFGTLRSESA